LSVSTVGLLFAFASADLPLVLVLFWPGAFSELPGPSVVLELADFASAGALLVLPEAPLPLDELGDVPEEEEEPDFALELLALPLDLSELAAEEPWPTFSPAGDSLDFLVSLLPSFALALEGSCGASVVFDETAQAETSRLRPMVPRVAIMARVFIIIRSYQRSN
jgi:hypothetical protein